MRAGSPHVFERVRANGQVIEMRGRPLPGGGYVTTYTDITDYKRVEQALRDANETLEQRVEARTREAEAANLSRTRFLAAISHDVLQPMNAARLFASALHGSESASEQRHLAERVDTSLRAAEELLDGLLDISRLDAGALKPARSLFALDELLREVAEQFAPLAASRQLTLAGACRRAWSVLSDRRLLRRVLQNFVANALRYTQAGRRVVRRAPARRSRRHRGLGQRPGHSRAPPAADLRGIPALRAALALGRARPGPGPVDLPARVARARPSARRAFVAGARQRVLDRACRSWMRCRWRHVATGGRRIEDLAGLRVLCLDNDRDILDGMSALLQRWGVEVSCAETIDEALALARGIAPDVLLADYHLHDRLDGLGALDALRVALRPGRAGCPAHRRRQRRAEAQRRASAATRC